MKPLKLITINIEGDNHLKRLESFLAVEQADVVCMQEVFEVDIPKLQELSQTSHFFYQNVMDVSVENTSNLTPKGSRGTAVFSKVPFQSTDAFLYESLPIDTSLHDGDPRSGHRTLLWVKLDTPEPVQIATTHFTWSPNGSVTNLQRTELQTMLSYLKPRGEHILCGDFNAPRGKEIFDTLATIYTDNIPQEVDTTIDKDLHRTGLDLRLVVDGVFTTNSYRARDVKVVKGVSDHCAVVASIDILPDYYGKTNERATPNK